MNNGPASSSSPASAADGSCTPLHHPVAKGVPTAILESNPPLPRTRVPTVIEAVAIGRGLVDEASAHIHGNAFGNGCTMSLHSVVKAGEVVEDDGPDEAL